MDQIYEDWQNINTALGKNTDYLQRSHPSCHRGNHAISSDHRPHETVVGLLHKGLRRVMHRVGNLYAPQHDTPQIANIYHLLEQKKKEHVQQTRSLKQIYDEVYGPNASRPDKTAARAASIPVFLELKDLHRAIVKSDRLTPAQSCKHDEITVAINETHENAADLLQLFKKNISKQPAIVLRENENLSTVKNSGKGTDDSLGYKLYLLKQISEHDMDDIQKPACFAHQARKHFSQSDNIYPTVADIIDGSGIADNPMILNVFTQEKNSLTADICTHVATYRDYQRALTHLDRYVNLMDLGLDDEAHFQAVKHSSRPVNAARKMPKPLAPPFQKGKCPFGHG